MSLQRKQISIEPEYLLQISKSIQTLNYFYEQEKIGSLSNEYRAMLAVSFGNLNQDLQTYSNSIDASTMIAAAILKCKTDIEIFCLEKLGLLLSRQTQELGDIIKHIVVLWRENVADFQRVILQERRKRAESSQNERDKIITKLKEELLFRKDYISQLKQRLSDVENQNSKIYQKIINNAKSSTDRALSPSPKRKPTTLLSHSPSKFITSMLPSHKTLSAKQVQETIFEIMETKQRQQQVKNKRVSLNNYLKTYFRFKFGMKDLADETEQSFKQAVQFFAKAHQKNIFIVFLRVLAEQCEEAFFWEQKLFCERLIRIVKRYLNQKDNISLDQLQQLYSSKLMDDRTDIRLTNQDIKYILMNTYKTPEIESLYLILKEILVPKLSSSKIGTEDQNTTTLRSFMQSEDDAMVPSKMLINEILNYELSRHLLKIQDILRVIRDIDSERGYLNLEQLESVLARLKIPEDKIKNHYDLLNTFEGRFVTYSEVIQCVEKIRKSKNISSRKNEKTK